MSTNSVGLKSTPAGSLASSFASERQNLVKKLNLVGRPGALGYYEDLGSVRPKTLLFRDAAKLLKCSRVSDTITAISRVGTRLGLEPIRTSRDIVWTVSPP